MAWNEIDSEGVEFFKQHGGQIIQLSDAEAKRWEKAVEPVVANYKKDMLSKGFKSAGNRWLAQLHTGTCRFLEKKAKEQGIKSPYR